jgi:signal peptidase I
MSRIQPVSGSLPPSSDPAIAPSARELAERNAVNWREIQGSGEDGLILEMDILERLKTENLETASLEPRLAKRSAPLWWRFLREVVLETLLPAWLVVTFVVIPVGVRGDSMSPSLESGDYLVVWKAERWLAAWGVRPNYIQRGDIIVTKAPADNPASFEPMSRFLESLPLIGAFDWELARDVRFRPYLIKRVIGVPGDTVEVRAGQVYVNDARLTEPYTSAARGLDDAMKTVVRPGTFYVMGDNRAKGASLDSRAFGLVRAQDVSGRAVFRLLPLNRLGTP